MSAFLLGLGFRADMGTTIRKLVLLKLIDACHDDGSKIFPALTTVAQAAQCSVRQVQREVKAFLDTGLLVMVREGGKGPGSTCEYRLDLDVLEAISKRGWDAVTAAETTAGATADPEIKGDTVSPLIEAKGDTGDTLRVTPATDKGDSWSPTTPYYPLRDPSEREGAREAVLEDDPKKLAERFRALEIGRHSNPWPGLLKSSGDWPFRQFVKLSPEDRRLAEDRRDLFLASCPKVTRGDRRGEPDAPPLGVYLRDRRFLLLNDVAPNAVAKAAKVQQTIEVPPFGPVWGGKRYWLLLGGPDAVDIPLDLRGKITDSFETLRRSSETGAIGFLRRKGISLDADGGLIFPDGFEVEEQRRRTMESGYPAVNRLHEQAKARTKGSADAKFNALADLCEAVPVGSDMFARWLAHDDRMGWPAIPDPGNMRVVWFPKGGPSGLDTFKAAARAIMAAQSDEGRGDEHAA